MSSRSRHTRAGSPQYEQYEQVRGKRQNPIYVSQQQTSPPRQAQEPIIIISSDQQQQEDRRPKRKQRQRSTSSKRERQRGSPKRKQRQGTASPERKRARTSPNKQQKGQAPQDNLSQTIQTLQYLIFDYGMSMYRAPPTRRAIYALLDKLLDEDPRDDDSDPLHEALKYFKNLPPSSGTYLELRHAEHWRLLRKVAKCFPPQKSKAINHLLQHPIKSTNTLAKLAQAMIDILRVEKLAEQKSDRQSRSSHRQSRGSHRQSRGSHSGPNDDKFAKCRDLVARHNLNTRLGERKFMLSHHPDKSTKQHVEQNSELFKIYTECKTIYPQLFHKKG